MKMRLRLLPLLLLAPVGGLVVTINTQSAMADCNFYGCSRSSVAECNFYGCPKAPMGPECNFYGCPPSPQLPKKEQPAQPPVVYTPGGSPQAIKQCMNGLLYKRELVCTRESGCSRIPEEGFGGWQYGNVRTQTSDTAAAQACQNAR